MAGDQIKMDFGWVDGLIAQMHGTKGQLDTTFGEWTTTADAAIAVWPDGVGGLFTESKEVLARTSEDLREALFNLTTAVGRAKASMEDGFSAASRLFG